MPFDSHPRVIRVASMSSPGAIPMIPAMGSSPKTWPIWKSSFPAPPSSVMIAELSSEMNRSSPASPSSVRRPLRVRS